MENQNDSSSDDEPDTNTKEVYFPSEFKLLSSDDLIVGHNYYVIDANKYGKNILYERPNKNYSSGPFTYYGKYIEKYPQLKLNDLNNETIDVYIYKFYDKYSDRLTDKLKYTRDNFDKKNIEMYKNTNVSTYKHSYLYLDEESTHERPLLVNNVKVIEKTARNVTIPRNTKAIPVATPLLENEEPNHDEYEGLVRISRRYFGGKKKRKTKRKNSKKIPKKKKTQRKKRN